MPERLFGALSLEARLRCLLLLQQEGQLCVCELTHALDLQQPIISRHLAQLREAGWVEDHRRGKWVYYRVNTKLPAWAQAALRETAAGIAATSPYANDRKRLAKMPNRPGIDGCS